MLELTNSDSEFSSFGYRSDWSRHFTIGKNYNIFNNSIGVYVVKGNMCDIYIKNSMLHKFFVPISEIRSEKIDVILND
jgi:hypothetical protein